MSKILIAIALIAVLLTGCTKYYKVSDPLTGETYYTTDVKTRSSGAVNLRDAKTNRNVTIQNSEVTEITEDEFNVAVNAKQESKTEKPAETPAPEATPATPAK